MGHEFPTDITGDGQAIAQGFVALSGGGGLGFFEAVLADQDEGFVSFGTGHTNPFAEAPGMQVWNGRRVARLDGGFFGLEAQPGHPESLPDGMMAVYAMNDGSLWAAWQLEQGVSVRQVLPPLEAPGCDQDDCSGR